mmetsp:Transcript_24230/g.61644  ORF Transcript_24230/g.61644 Transcript_24230/m.61644 type:complete len:143 (+) Transcript_24230:294-722(+)
MAAGGTSLEGPGGAGSTTFVRSKVIGGEVVYASICKLNSQDMSLWSLKKTRFFSQGVALKETIAYADSCEKCSYNTLTCKAEPEPIETGKCLCMWRVNGAVPKTGSMPCARCLEDCIGMYTYFDLGQPQQVSQNGVCVRKAD